VIPCLGVVLLCMQHLKKCKYAYVRDLLKRSFTLFRNGKDSLLPLISWPNISLQLEKSISGVKYSNIFAILLSLNLTSHTKLMHTKEVLYNTSLSTFDLYKIHPSIKEVRPRSHWYGLPMPALHLMACHLAGTIGRSPGDPPELSLVVTISTRSGTVASAELSIKLVALQVQCFQLNQTVHVASMGNIQ